MNDVYLQKEFFRNLFKKKRSALSRSEVINRSNLICENFLTKFLNKIENYQDKKFALYHSAFNEVETDLIKNYFIDHKIIFAFGKINHSSQIIEFLQYHQQQHFEANAQFKNIIEPIDGEKIIPDFIITPLLAFDENFTRLGMGKGFYDRTIANLRTFNSKIKTIALAYDFQQSDSIIPCEKHDLALDFIILEKNIFFLN